MTLVKATDYCTFKPDIIAYNSKTLEHKESDGSTSKSLMIMRSTGFIPADKRSKELIVEFPILYCPYGLNNMDESSVYKPSVSLSFHEGDAYERPEQVKFYRFLETIFENDRQTIIRMGKVPHCVELANMIVFPNTYLTADVMDQKKGVIKPPMLRARITADSMFYENIGGSITRIAPGLVPKACWMTGTIKMRWLWFGMKKDSQPPQMMVSNRFDLEKAVIYRDDPFTIGVVPQSIPQPVPVQQPSNGEQEKKSPSTITDFFKPQQPQTGIYCECGEENCDCPPWHNNDGWSSAQPSDPMFDSMYQYNL